MSHPAVDANASLNPLALERLQRFGGNALLRDMIELFLVQTPQRLQAARDGVRTGNAEAVRMAAYSMKASCAQLGAARMQTLSTWAEWKASHDLAAVAPLLSELEHEFTLIRPWLEKALPPRPVYAT